MAAAKRVPAYTFVSSILIPTGKSFHAPVWCFLARLFHFDNAMQACTRRSDVAARRAARFPGQCLRLKRRLHKQHATATLKHYGQRSRAGNWIARPAQVRARPGNCLLVVHVIFTDRM